MNFLVQVRKWQYIFKIHLDVLYKIDTLTIQWVKAAACGTLASHWSLVESLLFHFQCSSLLIALGRYQKIVQVFGPLKAAWENLRVLCSTSCPVLASVAVWEVSRQMGNASPFFSSYPLTLFL